MAEYNACAKFEGAFEFGTGVVKLLRFSKIRKEDP